MPALASFIEARRSARDVQMLCADCYTFTLASGLVLTYTNADVPIALNGFIYAANAVLVDGLQYKTSVGLDVDAQKVTIAARASDTIGGTAFLVALAAGAFDGCLVRRERAFLADWSAPPVGAVILFQGRVTTVDQIGRTSAEITVASDLVLLDVQMPRNVYQPTCNHTLYDSGCSLVKNAYGAAGTVGAGATTTTIPWAAATDAYAQGTLVFASGANIAVTAGVRSAVAGALILVRPLRVAPAVGDAFTAYQGCDHTLATCTAKFANAANFRGFPFVPVPETAY